MMKCQIKYNYKGTDTILDLVIHDYNREYQSYKDADDMDINRSFFRTTMCIQDCDGVIPLKKINDCFYVNVCTAWSDFFIFTYNVKTFLEINDINGYFTGDGTLTSGSKFTGTFGSFPQIIDAELIIL